MAIGNIAHRQVNQAVRIGAGVVDGSLSKPEAKQASQDLHATHQQIRGDRLDGGLTPQERGKSQLALNDTNREIAKLRLT